MYVPRVYRCTFVHTSLPLLRGEHTTLHLQHAGPNSKPAAATALRCAALRTARFPFGAGKVLLSSVV